MIYSRDILRNVDAYVPGEQPRGEDVVKLNTNENPYPPSAHVIEALRKLDPEALRKYPDPLAVRLRTAIARRYGCPGPEWVFASNGMDEVLALAVRTFVDPGDAVVSVYPTYSLYATLAALHGAVFTEVDLEPDFGLPAGLGDAEGRLLFLPRPHAPSGVAWPREAIEGLVERFTGLVLIDEAYVDFADDDCMDFAGRYDNVIVGRTFSKSFSMAGVRLGFAVAHPDLVAEFLKTKDSYNLNAIGQALGLAALDDYALMEGNAGRIRATRLRLTEALRRRGFEVPDSQANFVLMRHPGGPESARRLFQQLRDQAILVRYFDARRTDDCLRVSVGTDEEIDHFLAVLKQAPEGFPGR